LSAKPTGIGCHDVETSRWRALGMGDRSFAQAGDELHFNIHSIMKCALTHLTSCNPLFQQRALANPLITSNFFAKTSHLQAVMDADVL
jgi:hypothetical protein